MASLRLIHLLIVLIEGLTTFNVLGALPSTAMSGPPDDASDITWAHAVNSASDLDKALDSAVDFLEADVSLGYLKGTGFGRPVPVMAHPPQNTSDISLDIWLDTVTTRASNKGIKLDFKSLDVVEPSLLILHRYASKLNFPVWLNADVLPGPVNPSTIPVPVEEFISKCHEYNPNATLSIGWTTYWHPIKTPESGRYEWKHVRKMVDVIKCQGYENNHPTLTFPVRAIFATKSIKLLQWLLSVMPRSSLTVWSGKYDPIEVEDILRIRASFPKHKVYYDLPETIHKMFLEKKASVDPPDHDLMAEDNQWMTFSRSAVDGCTTLTYVRNDTIVFGKSTTTAVLQKNLLVLDKSSNLKITGRIKFFNIKSDSTALPTQGLQKLMLVLADVSLFTKNMTYTSENEVDLTTSDSEIIWSAINSSTISTFTHHYLQEETSCRVFKLDTSAEKSFEVWTVPCDTMLEESSFEEIAKSGVPEISSRKRLVLPEGSFMFGLVSSGDEHVVVYNLKIDGHKETLTSGSISANKTLLGIFTVLLSYLLYLILLL